MKYRKKPVVIDAEVYREGLEDGWTVFFSGNFFNYEKDFVTIDQANEFINNNMGYHEVDIDDITDEIIYECPFAYILTSEDRYYVRQGDYIVTNEDGSGTVYSPVVFHKHFEALL